MQKFLDRIPNSIRWFSAILFPIVYFWMVISFKMVIWGIASGRNPILVIFEGAALPILMGATTYLFAPAHKRVAAKFPTVLWALYVTICDLLTIFYILQYLGVFYPETYKELYSQNLIISYIATAANIFSAIMTCHFINKIHKKDTAGTEK